MSANSDKKIAVIHLLFFVCSCFFIGAGQASASNLTIEGYPKFEVKQEGQNWRLIGTYEIVNNGDETAKNVFPNLELGSWHWVGEPKTLAMKEKAVWNLDEILPGEKLACKAGDTCAGQNLPDHGLFPLLIRRHYEDMNSYQFTAAEVLNIVIGELTGEAMVSSRAKPLVAKLAFHENGNSFGAKLELKNISQVPKKVSVAYFTSREIEVMTQPKIVELSGGAVNISDAELKNFSGLEGSSYAVFAVMQWEEFGVRNSLATSGIVRIEKPKHVSLLMGMVTAAILGSLFLIYLFVLRPRRR
jgi:hypothetical protein